MAILELLNKKLDELKKNSPEEINKMYKVLNIVNEAKRALIDEEKLQDYDFSMAINLVNRNVKSFGIIDLEKNIRDIKNVLIARKKFDIDLAFSYEQERAINYFKERLSDLKKELEKLINENKNDKISKETLDDLNDFKGILEGSGKHYTYEMLEALFEVVDYDSLTYQDIKGLVSDLQVVNDIEEV